MPYVLAVLLVLALLSAPSLGCASAGGTPPPRPTSEMTETDRGLFDDGVDFVTDTSGLEGRWFADWQRDLDGRLERADVVAYVAITSVGRSEIGAEHPGTFSLVPEPQKALRGAWPEDMTLVSAHTSAGFASVERGQSRVLEDTYVLFVKWARDDAGTVVPRWHLSRAAGKVVETVERRFSDEDNTVHVIRHVN